MKMEIETRRPEDPTTLPSTSDDHLQIKNQIGTKIVTTITRAIPTQRKHTFEFSGASGISDTVVMIDDKTFKDDPFASYAVQKKHAYTNI